MLFNGPELIVPYPGTAAAAKLRYLELDWIGEIPRTSWRPFTDADLLPSPEAADGSLHNRFTRILARQSGQSFSSTSAEGRILREVLLTTHRVSQTVASIWPITGSKVRAGSETNLECTVRPSTVASIDLTVRSGASRHRFVQSGYEAWTEAPGSVRQEFGFPPPLLQPDRMRQRGSRTSPRLSFFVPVGFRCAR